MCAIAHPGYSATNLTNAGPTGLKRLLYKILTPLIAQPASAGALPEVLAAAGDEAQNGGYYGPTKRGDTRGPIGESRSSEAARDEAAASRLWSLSEELLGISWTIS